MRSTLVLALDRTGRLQTAYWGGTGHTIRPQFSVASPRETAGDLDGKLRLGKGTREIALRRSNKQNRRSRNLKVAKRLLSQEEKTS